MAEFDNRAEVMVEVYEEGREEWVVLAALRLRS